jgi:ABC-type multidrug transport system fused ATPase/permease subunit
VSHPASPRPALDGVSAEIPAGSFVAVLGPVGAGKSTLLNAIARMVKVPDGQVFLDGRDVNRTTLAGLRGAIGMVPQDTFLFHDTVRANLLWARPGASAAEMLAALEQAAAAEFVATLPLGLDTVRAIPSPTQSPVKPEVQQGSGSK